MINDLPVTNDYNEAFDSIYREDIPGIELIEVVPDSLPSENYTTGLNDSGIVSDVFLQAFLDKMSVDESKRQQLTKLIADLTGVGIIGKTLSRTFTQGLDDIEDEMKASESLSPFIPFHFVSTSLLHVELIQELESEYLDFEKIFQREVQCVLALRGIHDIKVTSVVTPVERDYHYYEVTITSGEAGYLLKGTDDRDLLRPFIWVINKLLLHKPVKHRFVYSIDSGDISYLFLEPNVAVDALKDYGFRIQAIDIYK